jgi:hypothetical protein
MRHNKVNEQCTLLSVLEITFHTFAFNNTGVPNVSSSGLTVTQYRSALVCPTAAFFLLQVWLFLLYSGASGSLLK